MISSERKKKKLSEADRHFFVTDIFCSTGPRDSYLLLQGFTLVKFIFEMSNRDWADTPELEELIVKALANGADDWTVSTQHRTEAFLAEKERLQGKIIHHYFSYHIIYFY